MSESMQEFLASVLPVTYIGTVMLPKDRWRDVRNVAHSRSSLAVLIWAIVAEFTDPAAILEIPDGTEAWIPAEKFIREHADEAEQQTIAYGRMRPVGAVIMEVLAELELADDYLRIKRNEQHMAFEDEDNR